MDGDRVYYAKQSRSGRERQILYDVTHVWNLRSKTDEHKGLGVKKRERETNHFND